MISHRRCQVPYGSQFLLGKCRMTSDRLRRRYGGQTAEVWPERNESAVHTYQRLERVETPTVLFVGTLSTAQREAIPQVSSASLQGLLGATWTAVDARPSRRHRQSPRSTRQPPPERCPPAQAVERPGCRRSGGDAETHGHLTGDGARGSVDATVTRHRYRPRWRPGEDRVRLPLSRPGCRDIHAVSTAWKETRKRCTSPSLCRLPVVSSAWVCSCLVVLTLRGVSSGLLLRAAPSPVPNDGHGDRRGRRAISHDCPSPSEINCFGFIDLNSPLYYDPEQITSAACIDATSRPPNV